MADRAATDQRGGRQGGSGDGLRREGAQKAYKRLDQADGDVEKLHQARKAIKRLRYAGELAEPVDRHAVRIARKAEHLQTELGEHQDAVVSAAFLARLGASVGTRPGDNGFTYGILMASELSTAERIRRSLASSAT